ncbi:hypothetical protein DdX_04527 [Ditylenchus destructor]|uniref:Uncharacterized protein n=1 Tax=Ditylenchus destructor TaxID=166010 RepID=A0AAD4N8F1_9BILA|nr:hypothetical protein DdX_04527 [Ditylenchus destructor]
MSDTIEQVIHVVNSLAIACIVLVVVVFVILIIEMVRIAFWIVRMWKSKNNKPTAATKKKPSNIQDGSGIKRSQSKKKPASLKTRALAPPGRTPFPQKSEIACNSSAHTAMARPLAVSPCRPTTRLSESIAERSIKEVRTKPDASGEGNSQNSFSSKESAKVSPKDISVELSASPSLVSTELKNSGKDELRDKVRDILQARKRFLGDLPALPVETSEMELKPAVKTHECRIDMPDSVAMPKQKSLDASSFQIKNSQPSELQSNAASEKEGSKQLIPAENSVSDSAKAKDVGKAGMPNSADHPDAKKNDATR